MLGLGLWLRLGLGCDNFNLCLVKIDFLLLLFGKSKFLDLELTSIYSPKLILFIGLLGLVAPCEISICLRNLVKGSKMSIQSF